jgi:hypothetical protein
VTTPTNPIRAPRPRPQRHTFTTSVRLITAVMVALTGVAESIARLLRLFWGTS